MKRHDISKNSTLKTYKDVSLGFKSDYFSQSGLHEKIRILTVCMKLSLEILQRVYAPLMSKTKPMLMRLECFTINRSYSFVVIFSF